MKNLILLCDGDSFPKVVLYSGPLCVVLYVGRIELIQLWDHDGIYGECIAQTVALAFKTLERLLVVGLGHVVTVHRRSLDAIMPYGRL